ncbi:MAG: sugar ABC transporter permease [Proteobacteria bacterium]|nr:sugar ABC transporter permease [Pseudomonadota bacterium]
MRWLVLPVLAALDPPMRWIQRRIGIARLPYVFLLPTMVIFGLFSFLPSVLNIWISFTGGSSTLIGQRPFVGLQNYEALLACESIFVPKSCPVSGFAFWTGMWNTLTFAVVQVPVMTAVALATAIVLNRRIRARGFWRALFFYPVMLSPVVVAVVWDWVLKRRGILNALLTDLTSAYNAAVAALPFDISLAPFRAVNWLGDAGTSWPFFWIVFVYSWSHLGFYMLILLAGLQAIPKDLYEAAEMDGTPAWRVFARITVPLLMPTLLVVLVLSLIRAFQVFDEVYVLTGGGPGTATRMVIQHIYETAFVSDAKLFGIAAASSVLLAGVILVLTLVQLALTRRQAGG